MKDTNFLISFNAVKQLIVINHIQNKFLFI